MTRSSALLLLVLAPALANAFEVKSVSPGMAVTELDTSKCRKVDNADSGVPGLVCDRTVGGDKAEMRLAVHDGKIVAAIFKVDGRMSPVKDALIEKYGTPNQPNQFMESYSWRSGPESMSIEEKRVGSGYSIIMVNFDLFNAASKVNKERAKKDI